MAQALKNAFALTVLIWIAFLASLVFPSVLQYGIQPRTLSGLAGILASPLLHANLAHLLANTAGLLVLGTIFFASEKERAYSLLAPIWLLGGLTTWLLARGGTVHIGASGIVYGLTGFLLGIGIFRRRLADILVALLVFIVYGGTIWGVLPRWGDTPVSWEGHLAGFAWGVITAWKSSPRRASR